jgi:Eukaryotic aspartyl protease
MRSIVYGGAPGALLAVFVCACSSSPSRGEDTLAETQTEDANRAAAPLSAELGPESTRVTRVPLSGCSPYYTMPVTVGSQTIPMTFDTGSGTLAVAAQGCESCEDAGVSPLYVPGPTAVDENTQGSFLYDEGEIGWTGEIYKDDVRVAGLSTRMTFVAVENDIGYVLSPFGCDTPSGLTMLNTSGIIGFSTDDALVRLPGGLRTCSR